MRRPSLIFDFGNVVAHFDYCKATEILGRHLGETGTAILERLRPLGLASLVKQYETGHVASETFSAEFCALLGLEISHADFAAAWSDIFWLNEPVARLVKALKAQGYRLVLGSNTNDLHARRFRHQFADTLAHFDRLVLSFEIGHAKPSAAFYRACVEASAAPAEECLFIDDLPENIDGARAAGLVGLLYRDEPTLRSSLARLGVEIPES